MEDVGEVKAPLVSTYYAIYLEKDELQPSASVISWQRSLGDNRLSCKGSAKLRC